MPHAATTTLPGHPHVSVLSPLHPPTALVTEEEVLAAVLGRFSLSSAEKFVQEVFWRTYWKGWLEMRPGVWTDYRRGVLRSLDRLATEGRGSRRTWGSRLLGRNRHRRLRPLGAGTRRDRLSPQPCANVGSPRSGSSPSNYPGELGADFFLRHLLDGDPASNTLSWRWVAGLQTPGKHYLARGANIAKYTEGRFNPGLPAQHAGPSPLDRPATARPSPAARRRAVPGKRPHGASPSPRTISSLPAFLPRARSDGHASRLRRVASQPAFRPPRASSPSPTAHFTMPPPGTATASAA